MDDTHRLSRVTITWGATRRQLWGDNLQRRSPPFIAHLVRACLCWYHIWIIPHDAVLFLVLFLCAQTAVGTFQATAGTNLRHGALPILFGVPKGARVLHWAGLRGSAQCQSPRHAKSGGCSQYREMLLDMGELVHDARLVGCHATQACQQSGWNV